MLAPGDKLRTRLLAGEGKSVAIAALEGSKLSVTVKRAKRSSVEPRLEISGPDAVVRDFGKRVKASKKIARAKGVAVDESGVWRAGFFALAGGGDVDVSVTASMRKSVKLKGSLASAESTFEDTFAALPGSQLKISIKTKGKVKWTPVVEILDPNGENLMPPTPAKRGGIQAVTDLLGDYRVRVSGGPGAFLIKVAVKPPKVKGRALEYKAVEALPIIESFTPGNPENDSTVRITVKGAGFSGRQSITVSTELRGHASSRIGGSTTDGVYANLDLTGVPAGSYRLGVSTAAGNTVYADGPIVVANRAPGVLAYSAPEFPAAGPVELKLTGRGYDDDCVVELHRSIDQLVAPVSIEKRDGHQILELIVDPPAYQTGAYDVTIRDPSGQSRTFPEAIHIVGYTEAPDAVLSASRSGVMQGLYPRDTAFDSMSDRVLIAVVDNPDVTFVLIDAKTMAVVDTFRVESESNRAITNPRVAYDPVGQTFAMTWVQQGSADDAFVRICSASDLDSELTLVPVSKSYQSTQVDIAANDDDGGYVAVWEIYGAPHGAEIRARQFDDEGTPNEFDYLVFDNASGLAWEPAVVYRGDGTYVVGHVGATQIELDYALRRVVLESDGRVLQGSFPIASSVFWSGLFQPEIAVNPNTEDVLLCFSYSSSGATRPAFVLLTDTGARPEGDVRAEDGEGLLPYGFVDGVVWNPERNEFVVGLSLGGGFCGTRRVESDGRLRPAWVQEEYEGIWAVPWSGPEPGQLGLTRLFDGDDDGYYSDASDDGHIMAGPLY